MAAQVPVTGDVIRTNRDTLYSLGTSCYSSS